MPFGDLQAMALPDYLAAADTAAPLFFVHIPKTAGSSFARELAKALPPYRNVHIDYTRRDLGHDAQLRGAVEGFVAGDLAQVRSASGHVPFPLASRIRDARPGLRLVTMLRAPARRVISDYRYQRTEMHPPHEEFRRRFPTIESYIEHPGARDKMAMFLAGPRADAATVLRRADEDYAFIGLLEMYAFSFNTIFALAGAPGAMPRQHLRRTPDAPETAVEITPELLERIRALNPLDTALYAHVARRLRPHRDAWLAARKAGAGAGAGKAEAGAPAGDADPGR